jgi:hypothetical protein
VDGDDVAGQLIVDSFGLNIAYIYLTHPHSQFYPLMRIIYACFTCDMAGRSPVKTSEVTMNGTNSYGAIQNLRPEKQKSSVIH